MPRAVDRSIPDLDKDPNRFGTDYANPLGAISDAAGEAGELIRDSIVGAIKEATGIDLTGFVNFIDWLNAQINLNLRDLAAQLQGIGDTILNVVNDVVQTIKDATGLDLAALAALDPTKILGDFQKFLDGVFALFMGGTTGSGKTVTEVLAALGGWLQTVFKPLADLVQSILDAIAAIKPGNIAAGVAAGIDQVRDTIEWILGIGQAAQDSAKHANTQIEQIRATAAGGGGDEFDYPLAPNLPAPWIATGSGSGTTTWGPDGNGVVRAKLQANTAVVDRQMHYRRSDVNLLKPDCTVTVVLSNPPGDAGLGYGVFWIEAQKNATNQECVRVKVGPTVAQFESVSASGAVTKLGPEVKTPRAAAGDVYDFKIVGNVLTLHRNGITAATYTGFTALSGRQIGFGATQPIYIWISGHPCPEFSGITWF